MSAALYEEHEGTPYATAIVARVDRAAGQLVYVNAGHPSGYLLRYGAPRALESQGPPLGLLPGARYATTEVVRGPGDIGVLVTDGITEALEGGPTTLSEALSAMDGRPAGGPTPAEICEALLRASAQARGPVGADDWHDDRTVLVFAVDPVAPQGHASARKTRGRAGVDPPGPGDGAMRPS
jgi:sigma-B regulation protein RsbU (phosphoserine phosphatase)